MIHPVVKRYDARGAFVEPRDSEPMPAIDASNQWLALRPVPVTVKLRNNAGLLLLNRPRSRHVVIGKSPGHDKELLPLVELWHHVGVDKRFCGVDLREGVMMDWTAGIVVKIQTDDVYRVRHGVAPAANRWVGLVAVVEGCRALIEVNEGGWSSTIEKAFDSIRDGGDVRERCSAAASLITEKYSSKSAAAQVRLGLGC